MRQRPPPKKTKRRGAKKKKFEKKSWAEKEPYQRVGNPKNLPKGWPPLKVKPFSLKTPNLGGFFFFVGGRGVGVVFFGPPPPPKQAVKMEANR